MELENKKAKWDAKNSASSYNSREDKVAISKKIADARDKEMKGVNATMRDLKDQARKVVRLKKEEKDVNTYMQH